MLHWDLLMSLAGHHLVPCLFACVVIAIALSVMLRVFPQAGHRVWILYAAISKAALALCAGAGLSCLAVNPHSHGNFGLRLPGILPADSPVQPHYRGTFLIPSDLVAYAAAGVVIAGLIALTRRWFRLSPICRSLCRGEAAGEFPDLYLAFEELVRRARLPGVVGKPRLVIMKDAPGPAFTMGLRHPAVVLSRRLADELQTEKLRGIIAHELGHIRRLDYLGRWFAIILRDIMIWNPFVARWYGRLEQEQEKAADAYAAALMGDAQPVAAGLIEIAALAHGLPLCATAPPALGSGNKHQMQLTGRLGALEEMPEHSRGSSAHSWPWGFVLVAVFLLVQPVIAISLPNVAQLLLRSIHP